MRLKMTFELEKPELDINYRKSLISFIKHSLEEYDKELFNTLYEKGKNTKKTYCFAPILNQPKFEKEKVILAGTSFYIIFSAYNYIYALHLYNAFIAQKNIVFHLNQNSMKLKNIVAIQEKEIKQNSINIKFSSPLIVREHNQETLKDMYYSFEKEEKFNEYLKINILEQMQAEKLDSSLLEGFSMKPINARKIVVKVYEKNIECSIGIFNITGRLELLNYLYRSGLGSKKAMGFRALRNNLKERR